MGPHHIRILVANHLTLLRKLIADLLSAAPDMEVVGHAADGPEALAMALSLRPDLVLLDLDVPRTTGWEYISEIRTAVPESVVVILSHSLAEEDVLTAFASGVHGYLLKTMEPEKFVSKIRDAAHGELIIAPEVAHCILSRLGLHTGAVSLPCGSPKAVPNRLTPRETEIVSLIAGGATNREIGTALMLSLNTVKNHIKHIMEKLQVQNRTQVAAWASRSGMSNDLPRQ